MPTLRDLQAALFEALLTGSFDGAAPYTTGGAARAAAGLAVHRNNLLGNFADALGATFPVVRRLVGEEYFLAIAGRFQRDHPSQSGDLAGAGQGFAAYLGQLHGADRFAYLPDVARLEWLVHEALHAADHPPLDLALLARVDPQAYDSLHFALHPALRLFESPYPVLRIWQANLASADPEPIDLHSGGARVAVARRRYRLQFLDLKPGEWSFLQALAQNLPFAGALGRAVDEDSSFDAAGALRRMAEAEAIVAFFVPADDFAV